MLPIKPRIACKVETDIRMNVLGFIQRHIAICPHSVKAGRADALRLRFSCESEPHRGEAFWVRHKQHKQLHKTRTCPKELAALHGHLRTVACFRPYNTHLGGLQSVTGITSSWLRGARNRRGTPCQCPAMRKENRTQDGMLGLVARRQRSVTDHFAQGKVGQDSYPLSTRPASAQRSSQTDDSGSQLSLRHE